MSISAVISSGAILTLIGAMVFPQPASEESTTVDTGRAPALVIPLTSAQGEPTEVATSALETTTVGGGGSSVRIETGTYLSMLGASADALDPSQDASILTEPLEVDPFFVAGLTWDGASDLPQGTDVFVRVREGDTWSEWYLTEPEQSQRDDGVGRAGTEPFVTGGADGIQVRVTGPGKNLPQNLAVTMLPANPEGEKVLDESDVAETSATATSVNPDSVEELDEPPLPPSPANPTESSDDQNAQSSDDQDAQSGDAEVTTQSGGVPAPRTGVGTGSSVTSTELGSIFPASTSANGLPVAVSSRADWGADESIRTWGPSYASASFVVVHHTAGTNNYTMSQSASVVRGIYQYHAVTLGWGDIGYNFLVDKWGRAFEGRAGSLASAAGKMVVGAHDLGFNTGTMGVSMIGNYSSVTPSNATLDTVGKLAGWQLARAGVSATGSGALTPTISNGTLVAGKTVTVNRISGHRDTYATACPGNSGYAQLGTIRSIAATVKATTTSGSDPQGVVDSITPDSATQTVTVRGWAFDKDTTNPINVHVYIDSTPQSIPANQSRPDVKNAFKLSTDKVGYSATLNTTPGTHNVCVYTINVGGGTNQFLRCQTITITTWSSSGFVAGDIISDSVMFASTPMTADQVQSFLSSKNSSCRRGSDGTACLKDYRTTSRSMSYSYCEKYAGATNETAAQVIAKAATACGVNPRVLITMLQKEQGLVTASSSSLTATKYQKAMGLSCPDSSACDPAHAGFAPQVYGAASRLVTYGEKPQSYNYRVHQTTRIAYHPNASCGSASVTIKNRATAALYNYTPYQPNPAALANIYGTGDSCSSYGNRNFWRLFNDWFGSTH